MADRADHRSYPRYSPPEQEPDSHYADEFIIPAKGEDGAFERCQFRCSAQLHGWMEDIVASKKFPFKRDGDLMRYGLYIACVTLTRMEPSIRSMQAMVDAAHDMVRRRELESQVQDHLDHLGKVVEKLRSQRAWGPIISLIAEERRRAKEAVEVEPYWGNVWLDTLDERFGIIETQAMAKLDNVDLRDVLRGSKNGSGRSE